MKRLGIVGLLGLLALLPALAWSQGRINTVTLIGANDVLVTGQYGKSVAIDTQHASGEQLSITLLSTADTTIATPAGIVYVLQTDPAVVAVVAALDATDRVRVICQWPVAQADWDSDANGASAYLTSPPCVFPAKAQIYTLWRLTDATGLNPGAENQVIKAVIQW